ncbi:MAG TPA: acetyl-CoA carboxylase biotin carboxylase subunit [Actinomycetota bacterium]|nr:acetyl-CoA carboxylase biotin carboxylase subunit [Actinomycetota bacterium]
MERVLVANRGEIAVRVLRACKELGMTGVAVYADPDRDALHVELADEAYHIGEATPSKSYLNVDLIVETAKRARADAVHPGYGFLAENAAFAQAVMDAGIRWVGPPPAAIAAMGDKVEARKVAERAGAPLVPGTIEPLTGPDAAVAFGSEHGYPIALKAAFGGGGRGMKVVRDAEEVAGALESAERESKSAFGRSEIYVERYLEAPRHVEAQILADGHGEVVFVGERDCSMQRRHQKLIEEAPAPGLPDEVRAALGKAACDIARVADYVNAGTIEFLYDPRTANFYFLEMNTRLQVEHPVTELVAGVDLVHAQLRVAAGEPLPSGWSSLGRRGHAIEVRINAEDPGAKFMPAPGPVLGWREPSGPGVRVDAGVRAGFTVPQAYDSLLAKLIVWGEDRDQARGRMLRALDEFVIEGVPTTIPFHRLAMQDPAFAAGDVSTILVEQGMDLSALAGTAPVEDRDQLGKPTPRRMVIELDGKRFDVNVFPQEEVKIPERTRTPRSPKALERARAELGGPGKEVVKTPMQGTIVKVLVANGDAVTPGQTLVVLEAMKMENHVTAHQAGTVSELNVAEGDTVPTGATIATIEAT